MTGATSSGDEFLRIVFQPHDEEIGGERDCNTTRNLAHLELSMSTFARTSSICGSQGD